MKRAILLLAFAACHGKQPHGSAGSGGAGSMTEPSVGSAGASASVGSGSAAAPGPGSAGAAAGSGDLALDIQAMAGPFATPAAMCDTLKQKDTQAVVMDCDWDAIPAAPAAQAPYLGAKLGTLSREGSYAFELALQTADGWYAAPVGTGEEASGREGTHTKIGAQTLAYVAMPSGPPAVELRVRIDQVGFAPNDVQKDEVVVVCGIGASHKPSCTTPIPATQQASGEPEHRVEVAVQTGRLTVTAKGKTSEEQQPLLGEHALAFP